MISDIKLIRTDTTLDLSQKAEKGMKIELPWPLIYPFYQRDRVLFDIWGSEWSDVEPEIIRYIRGVNRPSIHKTLAREPWQLKLKRSYASSSSMAWHHCSDASLCQAPE